MLARSPFSPAFPGRTRSCRAFGHATYGRSIRPAAALAGYFPKTYFAPTYFPSGSGTAAPAKVGTERSETQNE